MNINVKHNNIKLSTYQCEDHGVSVELEFALVRRIARRLLHC
jgi:hypothetical protein